MKTRILAAIALVVALPAAAQANSVMEQRAFAQQHEALNKTNEAVANLHHMRNYKKITRIIPLLISRH